MLGAIDDVLAVHGEESRRGRGQVVEITMDSGAAEVVAPPTLAADHATKPSSEPGSRAGTKYRTAIGNIFEKLGEKRIAMRTEDRETRHDVPGGGCHEALGVAGLITSRGHSGVAHFSPKRGSTSARGFAGGRP